MEVKGSKSDLHTRGKFGCGGVGLRSNEEESFLVITTATWSTMASELERSGLPQSGTLGLNASGHCNTFPLNRAAPRGRIEIQSLTK